MPVLDCDSFLLRLLLPVSPTTQANVHFEKASVLFNVAAVMSQQALQVDRGTPEGATQACKIFQVWGAGLWGLWGEGGGCHLVPWDRRLCVAGRALQRPASLCRSVSAWCSRLLSAPPPLDPQMHVHVDCLHCG